MKERVKFILEWERRWKEGRGRAGVAELCRSFGISRQTGYLWIGRYQGADHDLRVLEERSRRPHSMPTAVPLGQVDLVVAARKAKPRWGPRKLRTWLSARYPGRELPSASAMSAILRRHGLVTPRRRRKRRAYPVTQPFSACNRPNAVWCVDFKGWFQTGDGTKCYPLTLTDAYSRYLLRCEALTDPNGREVERRFDSAFREFGLPAAIRSDNGPPFASTGPGGLTHLAVWWLRLGIRLERIEPGKPQQNGRHERMHLTLKIEVDVADSIRAQQRNFDLFRRSYNEERPHEALAQKTPASVYERSPRRYPRALLAVSPAFGHQERLDNYGKLRWQKRTVFIANALAGEKVLLLPAEDTTWEVWFGPILLGTIDDEHLERGLRLPRRTRPAGQLTRIALADEPSAPERYGH